jgi:CRP-like cAMP-binding protein
VGSAGPGEVLGLPTVISGKVNRLTAEAIQLVECSFIAREAFLQFLEENGNAALSVVHMLSHMYDHVFDQILFLGLSSNAAAKFARLLLELPPHEFANDQYSKSVPFTHKEIGELIGASRETVTRLFARFRRQRLVRVQGSRLHILKPSVLRQLVAL